MTQYVVYAEGVDCMEQCGVFYSETDAVKFAEDLRQQQDGTIGVYKETCDQLYLSHSRKSHFC